jgi:hypothetical protein
MANIENMEKHTRNQRLRPLVGGGLTMVLWASAYPGIRAGLHSYSPVHLAVLRYTVAALTLSGYAVVKHLSLPRWHDLVRIALW